MTTSVVPASKTATTPARRLQATMAAARVSFTWMGVRKSLSAGQKAQAAEPFNAEGQYLSAAKKLLDTACPEFRALTSIRNQILAYWRGMSLPYPDPGLRLIRQDRVGRFNEQMTRMREELEEATLELDHQLPKLRQAAQEQLGELYDPSDYPPSVIGLFKVDWDFPSVEPPNYLLELNPGLYEQEQRRMVARFEEAVQMAEEAFTAEFSKLVSHLTERLGGSDDGKEKVFRDSAVSNLTEFFDRFRSLNVHSNEQLEELVETAKKMLRGVRPQQLRENGALRQQITSRLSAVKSSLDELLVDQPRRRIIRPQPAEAVA